MFSYTKSDTLPGETTALPGREQAMDITNRHYVNGNPIKAPLPASTATSSVTLTGCPAQAKALVHARSRPLPQ